jgi:hypothetical protein
MTQTGVKANDIKMIGEKNRSKPKPTQFYIERKTYAFFQHKNFMEEAYLSTFLLWDI